MKGYSRGYLQWEDIPPLHILFGHNPRRTHYGLGRSAQRGAGLFGIIHQPITIPIYDLLHLLAFHIAFIVFLAYPTPVLLLASYAAENAVVSRYLKMFAICIIGLATSNYLQRFFLTICSAEAADLIQIVCLTILVYIFSRITSIQRFGYVDLREFIERQLQRSKP